MNNYAREIIQPVADFGNNTLKIPLSPVSYCEEMLLQPKELFLCALIKISSGDDFINFAKGSPEKFVRISRAAYNVYGINLSRMGCKLFLSFYQQYEERFGQT